MNGDDRTLLLDLENLLGNVRQRPRPLRARLEAVLAAAGQIHHAVAAYALPDSDTIDPLASMLAELRIGPLRVLPGADAAEHALLAHARYVHTEGGRIFVVGSADGRFAELAELGRVELVVWEGQPVAAKLTKVVHDIHRLPRRPAGTPTEDTAEEPKPVPSAPQVLAEPPQDGPRPTGRLLAALVTGIGIAAGQRLFDALLPRPKR